MSAAELFFKRLKHYRGAAEHRQRSFDLISNLRLLVVIVGIGAVVVAGYIGTIRQAVYAGLPFLLVFIILIYKHRQVENRLNIARTMVGINQRYLDRLNEGWVEFADHGGEFVQLDHPYSNDLDIFGPKSLFQWISVAQTFLGRQMLYKLLAHPSKEIDAIRTRQKAIRELYDRLDFCQGLECRGAGAAQAPRDPNDLIAYALETPSLGKTFRYIRVLPLFTAVAFILYFLQWITIQVPVILLFLQSIIVLVTFKKAGAPLNQVYFFKESLHSYRSMLELIETQSFKNSYLSNLQADLFQDNQSASAAMRRLESISNAIDFRYSMFYLLINIGLLWDIQCAVRLAHWKDRYGKRVGSWLEIIGTMEALCSLAVIAHIHPDWVYPEIEDQGQRISARGLGHPLLHPDKCVHNDIDIDDYSCIVTGSNMSGKSTWLRAIGINLVLAYAGAPVCAQKFRCSVMDIYTSMEIRDDLLEGVSTFYAELKRINMILEHSRRGKPMIYLIDEIFRGTNSLDRIAGAKVVLRQLSQNGAIGLISTHDFELCDLEKEPWAKFKNFHFQEQYTDGGIEFDYILRPGRCSTSNARYLMRMVGIDIS
ncbi:MAG TPA: DNA mismatch repair protein MutS [Syntrophomonadaceae bacterium]|nr:DNA mismatch repair protein MutS [Syntrophomonadaceae bacterium]HQE23026.1 DNA mismatch repair protein MutS [Syntrophomonadaceae bacterium]